MTRLVSSASGVSASPSSPVAEHPGSNLIARFEDVRATTESLTTGLAPEDCVVQSMEDVSPIKWHLAHTSWFFERFILSVHDEGYHPFHPSYDYLFNSYYVQAGERHCRAQRGYLSRPTVGEVVAYRHHVDRAMGDLMSSPSSIDSDPELHALVELGINHEQQHQELMLTDIKHVFSVNPLRPAYHVPSPVDGSSGVPSVRARTSGNGSGNTMSPTPVQWVEFEGGLHHIGWPGAGFHYDNEGPLHRRFIEPFRLADRLTTNGEYLEFMEDGGYQRPNLWMSEGWARRQAESWTEPFYWERRDGVWWTFTLSGMQRIDPAEPVCHVNWFEADAFARWSGARLPREDEWEIAVGDRSIEGNLANRGRHHPERALADMSTIDGAAPLRQMFGDVWEWTSSAYSPYPGYRPAPGAIGEYNGKFMCGQFVLRGGSCATPASHIRKTYRNFFHPDASWQFTGLRLARNPGE